MGHLTITYHVVHQEVYEYVEFSPIKKNSFYYEADAFAYMEELEKETPSLKGELIVVEMTMTPTFKRRSKEEFEKELSRQETEAIARAERGFGA